jgi:hypothetical protein
MNDEEVAGLFAFGALRPEDEPSLEDPGIATATITPAKRTPKPKTPTRVMSRETPTTMVAMPTRPIRTPTAIAV